MARRKHYEKRGRNTIVSNISENCVPTPVFAKLQTTGRLYWGSPQRAAVWFVRQGPDNDVQDGAVGFTQGILYACASRVTL